MAPSGFESCKGRHERIGRALDFGEEEGDGAGGEVRWHARSIAPETSSSRLAGAPDLRGRAPNPAYEVKKPVSVPLATKRAPSGNVRSTENAHVTTG